MLASHVGMDILHCGMVVDIHALGRQETSDAELVICAGSNLHILIGQ